METGFVIIGVNFQTAPLSVREKFWVPNSQARLALQHLVRMEGIDEALLLNTCRRSEMILWSSDPAAAASSALHFLSSRYKLRLEDWSCFYRLFGESALLHLLRVVTCLDPYHLGEPDITETISQSLDTAQKAGASGPFLDLTIPAVLGVAMTVLTETGVGGSSKQLPCAAVKLAGRVLGTVQNKRVLVMGGGSIGELAADCLRRHGAGDVTRLDVPGTEQLDPRAWFRKHAQLAGPVDVIISSVASEQPWITAGEVRHLLAGREEPLVIVDLSVPRTVDPAVKSIPNVRLFDIDDMEAASMAGVRDVESTRKADAIIRQEASGLLQRMVTESLVPSAAAIRSALHEVCADEVANFRERYGPFTADSEQMISSMATHIAQRVASTLSRSVKQFSCREQQRMVAAVLQQALRKEASSLAIKESKEEEGVLQ